jgi:hypothetical protein
VSQDRPIVVDLPEALTDYADTIDRSLKERLRAGEGLIPFTADYRTNRADDNPRNLWFGNGEIGFSNLFAAGGFIQYGLFRRNEESFRTGFEMLDQAMGAIETGKFRTGPEPVGDACSHGPSMILLGVVGEVLVTLRHLEDLGAGGEYGRRRTRLVDMATSCIDSILTRHYREDPPAFWEQSNRRGEPVADASGHIVVDPGHATEFAGFLAEILPFLPSAWSVGRWNQETVLRAAVEIHLFADRLGFAPSGVMVKTFDLNTGEFLPDTQAGLSHPTAPWWNVREHSAAALSLFLLTGDRRLVESYRKGQNAGYRHYPNKRIGGQMIQMVNPFTLEPLDVAPATGNLDPMHDARSRAREIDVLETLLTGRYTATC